MARLESLPAEVQALPLAPEARLRTLIERFMAAYASAQHQHRVLTEDVRFLPDPERAQVVAAERRVIAGFADAIVALRPELKGRALDKPLTMLLFGMMNWTFTWLRPDGPMSYAAFADEVVKKKKKGLG